MRSKILTIILTILLLLNSIPLTIFAIEETSKTYIYDNYTIEYNIVNSWENNQNIEIIITNTSKETIENWMLSYNFCGEIQGIWNAEMKTTEDNGVFIKNAGYNCVIESGCSVNFGYTLAEAEGFPSEFSMCQERASKTEGYEVTLNVIDSWEDNSFQGEIVISNNTNEAIECWELDIDSNFTIAEITSSWAATVSAYEEGKYALKGTYTNIIYPNSSTTLGFLGIKNGEPEIYDYSLTEIVVGEVSESEDNDDSIVSVEGMYYKEIQSDDEVDYDGNGIYFVRNQLLVTAYQDVSFEEIEALVEEIDAKIVGYIGITNDYQIEFNSDVSTEYLYQQIDNLMKNSLIEYASLNTAFKISPQFTPKEYGENNGWINVSTPDWHIKTIKADVAWENYLNKMSSVRVGLIDTAFDCSHIDLSFKRIWNNSEDTKYYGFYTAKGEPDKDDYYSHGTHVAGIMAGNFDNGIGISGVCPKNELYAYSMGDVLRDNPKVNNVSMMGYKVAVATLIINEVKVINISLNTSEIISVAATIGNKDAEDYYIYNAEIYSAFLQKLIDLGYDFLIVSAAGNANDNKYVFDEDELYGLKQDSNTGSALGAKAEYNSFWNYIGYGKNNYFEVRNRIIVVGSITRNLTLSDFSNIGDRVDVVAPGENILSTVNGDSNKERDEEFTSLGLKFYSGTYDPYIEWDGTSHSAPQVAGVAGMMYSVNPSLTAEQIKQIIVDKATEIIPGYGLLNAADAVNWAYFTPSVGSEEIYDGLLMGKTLKPNGDEFENVTINVYEYKDINANIPPNDMIKPTKGEEVLYTTTSNEFGDYVLRLGNNCRYWVEYVYEGYKTEKFITYINSRQLIVQDVTMERINTLETVISNAKEESQMGAYVEVVSTLQNDSFDGEYATKYDDGSYTFMVYSNDTGSVAGSSDENGVFSAMLDDGTYKISVNKEGYVPTTIQVEAKDEKVYDENGEILEKITLIPIEASIYGTVTRKNLTTGEVSPKSGHTVKILKNGEDFTSVTTQDTGTYRVPLNEYGDYTVIFDEEHQSEASIAANIDYELNCEFEYEEDDDENDDSEDDENDNSDDNGDDTGENDSSDPWSVVVEDEFILPTAVDDPSQDASNDNVNVSGDYSVNLKDGIYVDCGEYTYHYYVADYNLRTAEIWTAFHKNVLMYDVYKDGTLIKSNRVCCWYKRVVRSSNHNIWIHTEYISSVGVKKVEKDGEYKVYLTYTVKDTWNPNVKSSDTIDEHSIYLIGGSDIAVSVRNQ